MPYLQVDCGCIIYGIHMKKIRKYCLKLLPYLVFIVAAYIFFILGNKTNYDIKGLMHGIAGSFLSIPALYLIYELSKNYSQGKLNKELLDYAKMQIDRDLLSIVNQLMKVVLSYEKVNMSPEHIRNFLSQKKNDLIAAIKTNEYLGFQVFKKWSITGRNITKILENSFILQNLDNDQLIAIVELLKEIRSFEFVSKNTDDLYVSIDKNAKGYQIESGKNLNEGNNEYPDRCLLLKHLRGDKFMVRDFGDFALYQKEKLLQIYKVNDQYLDYFSTALFDLICSIKHWLELSDHEFLIDTKLFKSSLREQ
jgi:hypothetical protein